jgi:hypothetical protein
LVLWWLVFSWSHWKVFTSKIWFHNLSISFPVPTS